MYGEIPRWTDKTKIIMKVTPGNENIVYFLYFIWTMK